MTKLKPYPAYQESGVPWLGEIPAHWQQLPGRACFTEKKTPNVGMQETTVLSLSYGQIVVKPPEKLHGLVPASFETYQIIEPCDIVIRPTDLQNDWVSLRTGLAKTRGIITSAYMRLRTKDPLAPEYGHLLLHAYDLKKVFYGLGSGLRQNLGWRDFKYLPCLVPPPDEQAAIARFLSHIDRRTRRYIRAQKKLIALLEEQKKAIIHQTVTRGLDPNVRLKPSGVEWLGEIPEHWEVRRLKTALIRNDSGVWGTDYDDAGPVVLRSTEQTIDGGWHIEQPARRRLSAREQAASRLQAGDLLVTKSSGSAAHIGKTSLVTPEIEQMGCCFSNFMQRLRVDKKTEPRFLWYILNCRLGRDQMVYLSNTTTGLANLTGSILGNIWVGFPPIQDQRLLAEEIRKLTLSSDEVISRAHREIDLLREYRTRLIADVVTGKLDVRQAAANLPEEAEELEDWDADEAEEESDESMDEADVEADDDD